MNRIKMNLKSRVLNSKVNLEKEFTEIPIALDREPLMHQKVKLTLQKKLFTNIL